MYIVLIYFVIWFNLIGFFNETIPQIILASFTFPIKELIFENFPITHNDFNDIFKKSSVKLIFTGPREQIRGLFRDRSIDQKLNLLNVQN